MILVDSNIPMYLVGADEARKSAAADAVRQAAAEGHELVTDAEVYQEILHRYRAIRRDDAIGPCTAVLDGLVNRVHPIDRDTVRAATSVLRANAGLSARDAVHIAVMRHHDIGEILSFDQGFGRVPGVRRRP
ncbi:type II toxin-antitoxin system VapC family toxin [Euzebya tangerina]|uniref:type II toxin-antitoxin system VapC family toxin n=1 Tax=Euzebya tangerina TaxID=591198 RepID=UPI000E320A8F|nr:type II toxin-antitoxin system VapC family toxin [Euzebya tangerina]